MSWLKNMAIARLIIMSKRMADEEWDALRSQNVISKGQGVATLTRPSVTIEIALPFKGRARAGMGLAGAATITCGRSLTHPPPNLPLEGGGVSPVMLDTDLADLYGVSTKVLNQAVRRNIERFPSGFMFQLTKTEKQEVVTICDHLAKLKFSSTMPMADIDKLRSK